MGTVGVLVADPKGIHELSRQLSLTADQTASAVRIIDTMPSPVIDVFGWRSLVDAFERFRWTWSAEVQLLREACDQTSRALARIADELPTVDDESAAALEYGGPR
jgi:hypothetical protein